MNRYLLTAKSLITDSKIVLCTMFAFIVVGLGFLYYKLPLPLVLFLATCLAGIGYTTRKYFLSERRRLVPGMNESCAQFAIGCWLTFSVISIVLIVAFHGFVPEVIGLCVLALAFSLWVGCIERTALPILFFLYAAPFLLMAFDRNVLSEIGESYYGLPLIVHASIGFLFCLLGCGLAVRFYYITTSKSSPLLKKAFELPTVVFGRWQLSTCINFLLLLVFATGFVVFWPTLRHGEALSQGTMQEGAIVAAKVLGCTVLSCLICLSFFYTWQQLLQYFFPVNQKMSRVSHLLYGKVDASGWRAFLRIYGLGLTLALLIVKGYISPEISGALNEVLGFGFVMLPFVAASLLLYGIPIHFSRLWVSGASESRFETALTILLLVTRRSLVFAMLVLSVLFAYSMVVNEELAPALFASMIVIGLSALPVLVVTGFYTFIAKHEVFAIISFLLVGGATIVLTVSNIKYAMAEVEKLLDNAGAFTCISVAAIAATGCWFVCLYSAARSLSTSKGLMECQSMLFAPEI